MTTTTVLACLVIANVAFIIYQALVARATDKDAMDALAQANKAVKEAEATKHIAVHASNNSLDVARTVYRLASTLGYEEHYGNDGEQSFIKKLKAKKSALKDAIKRHKAGEVKLKKTLKRILKAKGANHTDRQRGRIPRRFRGIRRSTKGRTTGGGSSGKYDKRV